jgi:tetratricopeptide (TPR) repeat protein
MSKIFISYAREDQAVTELLAKALSDQGWSVWWDREIKTGTTWARAIERQMGIADCIIVLWSKSSVDSEWVRIEAAEGLKRKILIPIIIDDKVDPPLQFRQLQTVSLAHWKGNTASPQFNLLVRDIKPLVDETQPIKGPLHQVNKTAKYSSRTQEIRRSKHIVSAWAKLTIAATILTGLGIVFWMLSTSLRFALEDPSRIVDEQNAVPVVAVSSFQNLTGNDDLDWLKEGLANLVRDGLSQSRQVMVVSKPRWESIIRNSIGVSDAFKAAQGAKIDFVLSGEILSSPSGLMLTHRLTDVAFGTDIVAGTLKAAETEGLLASMDSVAVLVKQGLRIPYVEQVDSFAADFVTGNPVAYSAYVSGLQYFLRFDYEQAEHAMETALRLAPDFHMARYRLAFIFWVTGKRQEAAETLAKIPVDAVLNRREKLYIDGALAFLGESDFVKAIGLYKLLLEEFPYEVEAQQYLAEAYFHNYQEDAAIAVLQTLGIQEPENELVWGTLVTYLSAAGRYSEAEKAAQKYLKFAPEGPNPHSTLAEVRQYMGDYDASKKHYSHALELDPGFVPAQQGMAQIHAVLGEFSAATALWDALISSPSVEPQYRISAAFNWAWILRANGQCKDAFVVMDRVAVAIQEEQIRQAMALELRGKCNMDIGEYEQAQFFFNQAIELAPSAPTGFLFSKGLFELKRNEIEATLSTAEEISRNALAPDDPDRTEEKAAAYLTGMIELANGNIDEAIIQFRRSLKLQGYRYAIYQIGLAEALLDAGQMIEAKALVINAKDDRDPGDMRFDLERDRMNAHRMAIQIASKLGQTHEANVLQLSFHQRWGRILNGNPPEKPITGQPNES